MILSYEEFISNNYEPSQELEEGKLKNIIMATTMASSIMFGSHYLANQNKDNHPKIEHTQKVAKKDTIEKSEKKEYFPSDEIIEYIKNTEGWHEGWKDDGKGNPTTGWGFKQTDELKAKYPKGMSKKDADKYFVDVAIPERVEDFKKSVPNIEKYTQRQLDALFDLFYNVGKSKFTKGSPNLQLALKNGDVKKIVKNMDHDYNNPKLPGIKIRRDFERELFMQDA